MIIQVQFTDEGAAMIAELAKKANLPDSESFIRRAIGYLGAVVQFEERGAVIEATFPDGTKMPIDPTVTAKPDGSAPASPKTPPRPRRDKPTTMEKLNWPAIALDIIRQENVTDRS